MSYYETERARRQREIRNTVAAETRALNNTISDLQNEIVRIRSAASQENEELLRRLEAQAAALEKERSRNNAMIRQLDEEVRERERLTQERINAMQTQHTREIRAMEDNFRQENETLRGEIRNTRSEMLHEIENVRADTAREINSVRQETAAALTALDNSLRSEISDVNDRVTRLSDEIASDKENRRELAVYWTQEAGRLLDQIRNNFKPQLLDSHRIDNISDRINSANGFINAGAFDAGIANGNNAFYDLLDMKQELAEAELVWNYHYNAVRSREAALLSALDEAENRIYTYTDENGEVYTYDTGVDYWTNGQLSVLRETVGRERTLMAGIGDMTTAQLQETEEKLRSLQEQLALLENASENNVAMSISRYRTAVSVGEFLGENYRMVDRDGEYFALENREEYHAVYENPITHDRVTLIITPIADPATGAVQNHVDLLVGSATNDPIRRDEIRREVANSLDENHVLENCSFPCSERFGDRTSEEAARAGDIAAVAAGKDKVRVGIPGAAQAKTPAVQRRKK